MKRENLRKTGNRMEDLAAMYLQERGVTVLERNFRSREAEIDIIGRQGETLIFAEVKARRRGKKSGGGEEAVGAAKQKRICRCADFYMHEKGIDSFETSIRFDVIAIAEGPQARPEADGRTEEQADLSGEESPGENSSGEESGAEIRWIRDAFSYVPYGRSKPHWRVW